MKLLIDIPEHIYEHAKETTEDSRDEFDAMRAIANGTQQESRWEIPNTCEDAVSREAAIMAMKRLEEEDIERYGCSIPEGFDGRTAIEALQTLPFVIPQQRMGRWIEVIDEIREEIHATAEMHEDGDYYLRDEWIDEIIDKYLQEVDS